MLKHTIGFILLTLTILATSSKAETTCVTNSLGDRTCTTVTSGTTTGNILQNSTFGTGNTTTTTGWSSDGNKHTHGNFGSFPYQSGMDTSGGVWAGEGHTDDNIYQDVDLVGDGHLTQSQINEGFTSTQSADVWFWNSIENTFTLKQTITSSDGTVTTQTRVINDHDPSRPFNGGAFTNYTNVYTESANSQNDYTIRAEMYNETAGTAYDNTHRGPDVDNMQLSITTAGTTTVVVTPCALLGTCTSAGEDIADAVDLVTDDGVDLFEDLDTKIDDAIEDFEEIEVAPIIETVLLIEDDFGEIEEIKFEDLPEFIEESFTDFIETNDLVETFEAELKVEGITEEQFFEELGNEMMAEIGEEMMTEIIELNEPEMVEPEMEEFKEEEIEVTSTEETNEEVIDEKPTEEVIEERPTNTKTEEEPNATTNENESTTETSTTEETLETTEETESTGQKDEDVSTESEMAEDTEAEGQTETEDNAENVESETDVDVKNESVKSDIGKKVAKIIKKLEAKLKRVDDKIKATSYVLAVTLQNLQPDMGSYINKSIPKGPNLNGIPNDDFFDNINRIAQQQIYKDASLAAYTSNDPIAVQTRLLNEIESKKNQLKAEIAALRSIN
tara:strand:- start:840 stop:2687 length:1848 start_codon:yes stop_codon:yes gene_type:complete